MNATSDRVLELVMQWAAAERDAGHARADYAAVAVEVGNRVNYLDDHPARTPEEKERDLELLAKQGAAGNRVMEAEARASLLDVQMRSAAISALITTARGVTIEGNGVSLSPAVTELENVGRALGSSDDEMRRLAQDLLTSYQTFASDADGHMSTELEERAAKLGLDTDAWWKGKGA